MELRNFESTDADACPISSQRVAIIEIHGRGVTYHTAPADKRVALAGEARLLVAWPGQWRQDIFELDPGTRRDFLKRLTGAR